MQISVATSGYGIVSADNYFTLLRNAYLGVGKQFDFSASGLPTFYSTYTGKVLYELIRENLWIGGISGWLQLSREDVVTDLYATKLELASTSGVLNTKIDNVSGSLKDQIWASGSIVTAISDASGSAIITASGISVGLDNLLSGVITTHFHNDIDTISGYLISQDSLLSGSLISSMDSRDVAVSGTLVTGYNTADTNISGALKAQIWASGSIVTAITNASGAAVTNAVDQSQTIITNASGVLDTKIDNVSGALKAQIWTSGSIVTAIANASGAAVITASGGAVNVSTTNLSNASGTLNAKIWASGSIVTAIADASGAAVITASGIADTLYLKKPTSASVQMVYISGYLEANYSSPGYTTVTHGLGANYKKIISYSIITHDSTYDLKMSPMNIRQTPGEVDMRWYYDHYLNDTGFYIITASGSDRLNSAPYDIVYWIRS